MACVKKLKQKDPNQKIKKLFSLGKEDPKTNFMENFRKKSQLYGCFFPFYNRPTDPENVVKMRTTIADIKNNPKSYFNFGFDINDYTRIIMKMYFMRMEREIIRKNIEKKHGQRGGGTSLGINSRYGGNWSRMK